MSRDRLREKALHAFVSSNLIQFSFRCNCQTKEMLFLYETFTYFSHVQKTRDVPI